MRLQFSFIFMIKIICDSQYFSIKDTLECGQVFRFTPYEKGYLVYSKDKCVYCYNQENLAIIECEDDDEHYFYNYFDLSRDYSKIYIDAINSEFDILKNSASAGKGIRILNQDVTETLFSFVISQNNNIPRIKGILERLCNGLGERKEFCNKSYYTFPSVQKMAETPLGFYKSIGLGYRADYILRLARSIVDGLNLTALCELETPALKNKLVALHGVGPKVADCVTLFGYHRRDSFPVDTWIEKVYREDFNGKLTNRKQITDWFLSLFKENAGYYQQYLFHYKRLQEKNA